MYSNISGKQLHTLKCESEINRYIIKENLKTFKRQK